MDRVQAIESRLQEAKELTVSLRGTMVNEEAKEFLLRSASSGLTCSYRMESKRQIPTMQPAGLKRPNIGFRTLRTD